MYKTGNRFLFGHCQFVDMTDRKKTLAIGQVVDKKDRKNYIGHLYNSDRQKNPVWPLFKL